MVKPKGKLRRTDARVTVSMPKELAAAMVAMSKNDSLPYSKAVQLFAAWWVSGGDPRSLQPRQRTGGDLRDLAATAQADAEKDGKQ